MRIFNSLLRIDSVVGEPPAPFERPNPDMDFWVLEVWRVNQELRAWTIEVMATLERHSDFLEEALSQGAQLTLCVGVDERQPVARFEPDFIQALATLSIALQVHQTSSQG